MDARGYLYYYKRSNNEVPRGYVLFVFLCLLLVLKYKLHHNLLINLWLQIDMFLQIFPNVFGDIIFCLLSNS